MKNKKLISADLKTYNRSNIFKYVYQIGIATKQDISSYLGLSAPTVGNCLNELVEKGVVKYEGTASSTGGRKAQFVHINNDYCTIIGMLITKSHLRFIALDLSANILAHKKIKNTYIDPEKLSAIISKNLELFLDENSIKRDRISSVQIAIPGIISNKENVIELSPTLNFKNLSFDNLTKYIPYENKIINDADAAGFAEWWNSNKENTIIYLSLSEGIGGSIYVNGKHYSGANNHSAEFGHMCVVPDGKLCNCGRKGCLEAYCSTSVLSDDLGVSLDEFFNQVEQKNEEFCKILDEYIDKLAIGINNIYQVFDSPILIGGSLSKFGDIFIKNLVAKTNGYLIIGNDTTKRLASNYSDISYCYGAALYAIDKIINEI